MLAAKLTNIRCVVTKYIKKKNENKLLVLLTKVRIKYVSIRRALSYVEN